MIDFSPDYGYVISGIAIIGFLLVILWDKWTRG
jgi:hypothetical protein